MPSKRIQWCGIYAIVGFFILGVSLCTLTPEDTVAFGAGAAAGGVLIGVAIPLLLAHRLSSARMQGILLIIGLLAGALFAWGLRPLIDLTPAYQMGVISVASAILSAVGGAAAGFIANEEKRHGGHHDDSALSS